MIRVFIENKQYLTHIQYVFDTIFFTQGIKYTFTENLNEIGGNGADLAIIYARCDLEEPHFPNPVIPVIFIKDSGRLFGKDYLKPGFIPLKASRYISDETDIDVISIYNDNEKLFIDLGEDKGIIKTNIDIISDIFFMLTRYEEVLSDKRDKHDRFPASDSLAYRNGFLSRPIVNEHMDLLWSWIETLSPGIKRVNRWEGKSFAVCLSHDVDHILKNGSLSAVCRHTIAILLKLRNFKKAFHYFTDFLKNRHDYTKDPCWTFKYLTKTEKSCGFNSTYYFLAMEKANPDWRYDIDDVKVRRLIQELEDEGREIGYHGSLHSYNNEAVMLLEKNCVDSMVRNKPYGIRQHYLKFKVPITWRYQCQAGLLYDTTLTFAEQEGFRCGTCTPYKPYDILKNKVLNIWEIPLLVMEGTLQSPMYGNLTPEEGLERIINLIETVRRHQGVFTLLWHNSSFDYNFEGWKWVFEKTMEYLGKSDCVGLSGREVVERMSRGAPWYTKSERIQNKTFL